MSSYYIFQVAFAADAAAGVPSQQAINQQVRFAALPAAQYSNAGGWVGPAPRITRVASGGLITFSCQTTIVALYQIPDGQSDVRSRAILAAIQARLVAGLAQIEGLSGTWGNITITPYSAAVNGPVTWWQCSNAAPGQCAAVTRTGDVCSTNPLSTDAAENPIGPETLAPTGFLSSLRDLSGSSTKAITSLVWSLTAFGAIALAIYGVSEGQKVYEVWKASRPLPPLREPRV